MRPPGQTGPTPVAVPAQPQGPTMAQTLAARHQEELARSATPPQQAFSRTTPPPATAHSIHFPPLGQTPQQASQATVQSQTPQPQTMPQIPVQSQPQSLQQPIQQPPIQQPPIQQPPIQQPNQDFKFIQQQLSSLAMDEATSIAETIEDSKNSETFDNANPTEPGTLAELASSTLEKLNAVNSGAIAEQEHITAMSMLEASMKNIPESMDSERYISIMITSYWIDLSSTHLAILILCLHLTLKCHYLCLRIQQYLRNSIQTHYSSFSITSKEHTNSAFIKSSQVIDFS
jgi:hypothetical protein